MADKKNKICPRCKEREIEKLNVGYCNQCDSEYKLAWHKAHKHTEAFKESRRKSSAKWVKNNYKKYRAHFKLRDAILRGDIKRKPCEVCGEEKSDGHHEDYSKPLEIMWLCHKHHEEHHHSTPQPN